MKFELSDIDEFQIEITGHCNAACPQCPRNINGGPVNKYLPVQHLSRDIIDTTFTKDICGKLRQIFFCGSYGDPIMHPDFLGILKDFRTKNPDLWLYVHTNGGVRDTNYWEEIASIINGQGQIDFNIDGLADTNHLYRKKTDFDKIITNAKAFIDAGGRANWNFIAFKHNEHQVNEAELLAGILGFNEFHVRPTGRFFNHETYEEIDQWPVINKAGEEEYVLEYPTLPQFKNKSVAHLPKLAEEYGNLTNYFNETEIKCDALGGCNSDRKTKVVLTSHGTVMPCNFFEHNLFDARFHDSDILPGRNELSLLPDGTNQIQDLFARHDADNTLNIHNSSLLDIFKSGFWTEIEDSFNKKLGEGRFFECALTCGSKFHKVWDQLNMKEERFLITGGNRGLGLVLVNELRGASVARSENSDIVADITNADDIERIAEESLQYDVFINNAFDGPAGEPHVNFAQVNLLVAVFEKWKAANKKGHIINIGSSATKEIVAPEPTFERYRVTKAALEHASKQCTQAFRNNQVQFKTSLINFDRLDTPLSRSRDNWTGNGTDCKDIANTIKFITSGSSNTCIEEITSWLNKDYL